MRLLCLLLITSRVKHRCCRLPRMDPWKFYNRMRLHEIHAIQLVRGCVCVCGVLFVRAAGTVLAFSYVLAGRSGLKQRGLRCPKRTRATLDSLWLPWSVVDLSCFLSARWGCDCHFGCRLVTTLWPRRRLRCWMLGFLAGPGMT